MIMKISDRIKHYRKKAVLTQPELAMKLGVSQSTLNRWENDAREPSFKTIELLASILSVPASTLAFGSDCNTQSTMPRDVSLPKVPSLDGQLNNIIAFQGELGAYSHLATIALYPDCEVMPCHSFADAFRAVERGEATYAVIPIENCLGGRVADIHHLLPESNLYIVGEHFQTIEHCLLGIKGSKITDIKKVYSHEQALSQCRHRLHDMNVLPVKFSDTAGASRFVSQDKDMHKASIGSKLSSEIYDLAILQENMEDKEGNVTRFVVMSREPYKPNPQAGKIITSCIFFTRDIPASLYKALGGFATNDVNILKLESYVPMLKKSGNAHFYVDFAGSADDHNVALALDELQFYTTHIRTLGTYTENR